ncbi:MAG TPA: c-type cytochrome [Pyrinomonadaceae bacterium]|nr:c-type cytochrome [Pyrinomonadaceae bacterium]
MKNVIRIRILVVLAAALVFPAAWLASGPLTRNVHAGENQNSAGAPPTQTEKPFDQSQALAKLRESIAGKENEPAEKVFKNIQLLKGVPAGRLLRIMEMGYSRSLGVTCTHCHVPDAFEKDDKPTKQVARDMAAMVGAINNQHLKQIKNLKSETPVVNCTTCHRGQTKPALNLPEAKS